MVTHLVSLDLITKAHQSRSSEKTSQDLAAKYQKLFLAQLETLQGLRHKKGSQGVRVEHVHVHGGGQAVVGNLSADQ